MGKTLDNNDLNQVVFSGFSENKGGCSVSRAHKTWSRSFLGQKKGDGGEDGAKVKKNFPGKLSTKKYIPEDFGQKKYAQGGSVQVSLTITGQL